MADDEEQTRQHEFGLTFNCINDEELLCLTGCTRDVLITAWMKYGNLIGSPIRRPCVTFCCPPKLLSPLASTYICYGLWHIQYLCVQCSPFSNSVVVQDVSIATQYVAVIAGRVQLPVPSQEPQISISYLQTTHQTWGNDE